MGTGLCVCTREGMIRRDEGLWGRVNSCRADFSVSFYVSGAVLVFIIVCGTRIMGALCVASSPPTLLGTHVTYFTAAVVARVCN